MTAQQTAARPCVMISPAKTAESVSSTQKTEELQPPETQPSTPQCEIHEGSHVTTPGVITGKEALRDFIINDSWHYLLLWNKLYKAEIFKTLRLREDFLHEDEEISGKILSSCGKIALTTEKLYIYVKRRGSLIDQARRIPANTLRTFREMLTISRERCAILQKLGMNDELYHYTRKAPYGRLLAVLGHVNIIQYRHEISGELARTFKTLIASREIGYKLSAVKLILKAAMSMFRPFVKEA